MRARLNRRILRILVGPGLLLLCLALQQYSFRWTALVLFFPLLAGYVHFLCSSNTKFLRLIFVAFVIAVFLPIDVTLINYPGPPRFVPLVIGAPGENDVALADRGEIVIGGCISRGNDPRWVLVW